MKKLLSAVTSVAMSFTLMAGAFASSVSAAGGLSAVQPNVSLGEVLDVSANRTAADGTVEWLIPTVTAAPGQTVTMPVVVKSSSLAVAGAQFKIQAATGVSYSSKTDGDAYGSGIVYNNSKYAFGQGAGRGIVAADDSVVLTLAYTVPADCAEGTYDVKWSDAFVSDTDGQNITSKVTLTDGAIIVKKDNNTGKIKWVLDKVTAAPGETVTVKATVDASGEGTVAVAGAQFDVNADSPIVYDSAKEGGAYITSLTVNDAKHKFAFGRTTGTGIVAADKATVAAFTYKVPSDCTEGTYDVKWSGGFVSDADGKDITSRVTFVDGSITVKNDVTDGKVKWVLDNVTAAQGETVTLKAVVDDSAKAAVPVAGAQFKLQAADAVKYSSFTDGTAYGAAFTKNDDKQSFAFGNTGGKGVAAADKAAIYTVSYTVPTDCPDGTYPVKWADTFVSDTDGRNITSNIIFVDGSITVGKPVTGTVEWVIPKVDADAGDNVTLQVAVKGDADLPVSAAQFDVNGATPLNYQESAGKPYGVDLVVNDTKQHFAFAQASGISKTAKDGDKLFTITFKVPEDCADGIYPVTWAKQFVSDENGNNITDKVTFTDGWVRVGNPPTTTTTTTTSVTTTTTTTTVTAPKGGIIWAIDTVTVEPGQTATLNIKVVDEDNSKLPIAGAQFNIVNKDGVNYSSIAGSEAYGPTITANDAKKKFDFANASGVETVGANNANVAVLTYTVPATAEEGVYPVQFAEGSLKIFDKDGKDISDKIIGVDG
ncbi:cohesin domain-containing protein, partial [Ruminococcus flavefaciens]|uniref:cohesin domain-containing protein n=1 Tax=Ruminococcus flavefaciens TaxID=1265 RepID=UPI00056E6794